MIHKDVNRFSRFFNHGFGSVNQTRRAALFFGVMLIGLVSIITSCDSGLFSSGPRATVENPNRWRLVWHDEFDYTGPPNPEFWNIEVLGPGAYNRELQAYTQRPENVRAEDGMLIIEAHPIPGTLRGYTSARINTRNKQNMYLGRVEVRAKLPDALGTWPALWLLPVETTGRVGWPHSGEIDFMEHVGFDNGVIHASVHTSKYNWPNGNHHTQTYTLPSVVTDFHIYALEWTEESLDFYVDDVLITRFVNENTGWEAWPFDVPFYLIMNLAVGGEWGGARGVDRDAYPARFEIDWVRVYRER